MDIEPNFKIKVVNNPEEIKRLYQFIRGFSLDYPDYFQWVEKCRRELELGYKKAVYAIGDDGQVYGSVVFQPHKQEHNILELKNFRVNSEHKGWGIGSMLALKAEQYAKETGFMRIQGDAHPENPIIEFLKKRGYAIEAEESLYVAQKELILCKDL